MNIWVKNKVFRSDLKELSVRAVQAFRRSVPQVRSIVTKSCLWLLKPGVNLFLRTWVVFMFTSYKEIWNVFWPKTLPCFIDKRWASIVDSLTYRQPVPWFKHRCTRWQGVPPSFSQWGLWLQLSDLQTHLYNNGACWKQMHEQAFPNI